MKAYKGFDSDLSCRGFQYEVGKTYEQENPAVLCGEGFHATLQPIDVLRYYPPATSVFHEVELEDVAGPRKGEGEDSKVAGRVIKIGAGIDLTGLIKAQVDFVFANAKHPTKGGRSTKAHGLATASGDSGAATASGDSGAATASGYSGAATASGNSGAATASGNSGAATASGNSGAATASGNRGAATASGYSGAATASGNSGAATASGNQSVAIVTGRNGRARGAVGSWLVLTERDLDWEIVGVQSVRVDGEVIKADIWYSLRGGRVVAV